MTPQALAELHAGAMTVPLPYSADEIATLLASPGVFLCADAQGFAIGRAAADEAELLTIAVAPGARRKGIGRRLLAEFETGARARGAVEAFLEVAADNAPARGLYNAAGWFQVGLRRAYYRRPDGTRLDALVMRTALDRP